MVLYISVATHGHLPSTERKTDGHIQNERKTDGQEYVSLRLASRLELGAAREPRMSRVEPLL
jgi:hypothetical protein